MKKNIRATLPVISLTPFGLCLKVSGARLDPERWTYTDEAFRQEVEKLLGATVEIAKRSELHTFAVLPKRWVVERSFA